MYASIIQLYLFAGATSELRIAPHNAQPSYLHKLYVSLSSGCAVAAAIDAADTGPIWRHVRHYTHTYLMLLLLWVCVCVRLRSVHR